MPQPIYLDYNATTPVDPAVLDRMLPYFTERFGNASSAGHPYGWAAAEAVDVAREQVAGLIQAPPRAITFTSGATEALALALHGVAAAYARKGRHVVTVETEHKAVLDTCEALERDGFAVTYLPVRPDGRLDLDVLAEAITEETTLVAVMWANNETGVVQPVEQIADLVRERGSLFLTDATQALGKVPVDSAHADLLVGSGHKLYGPKGVGFLYASRSRPRVRLVPLTSGGGQEGGLRGGTLNTPGIVGLGAAAALAQANLKAARRRLTALRDAFEADLLGALDDIQINGADAPRLPNTANVTFHGVPADKLTLALRGLAVSTGSACASGAGRPSHVLQAMGLSADEARSSIRFSLGRFTTEDEVTQASGQVIAAVRTLREALASV